MSMSDDMTAITLHSNDESPLVTHQHTSVFKIYFIEAVSVSILIILIIMIWNRRLLSEISHRKLIEEELRINESSFRDLLKHSPDPTWLIDDNHKFIETNVAAIKCLGYDNEEEVISRHPSTFSPEFQPDGRSSIEASNDYIEKAKSGEIQRFEWIHLTNTGNELPVEVTLAPSRFKGKEIVFCSWRDISRRKQNEQHLQQLSEELDQRVKVEVEKNKQKETLLIEQTKSAAMGEMIGNIAHQWRQPLNSLNLLLYDLEDVFTHNECDSDYLNRTVSEASDLINHMSQTIDNFRNFFKSSNKPSLFSLKDIIIDCTSIVQSSMEYDQIKLSFACPDNLPQVMGYQHELAEVIMSLLGNAREAIIENETDNAFISTSIELQGLNLIVKIKDNGGGVAEDIMPKIFDPYFTIKANGTGMGLYMSQVIMDKHINGQINVTNINNGACFELVIPYCQKDIS